MPKVFLLTGTFVLLLCCETVFSQANQGCTAFATSHDGVRGCLQRKPTQKATNPVGHTPLLSFFPRNFQFKSGHQGTPEMMLGI